MVKVAAVVFASLAMAAAQTPPLLITDCIRPTGGECVAPIHRSPYPDAFVTYLFQSAKATFEAQAVHKLRVRHPQPVWYRFDLGDLSIRYDEVRYTRKTMVERKWRGVEMVGTEVIGEVQTVALPGWLEHKDESARLFTLGWLMIWNSQLVEPFPVRCKENHPECVDLAYMVNLTVANAKFHVGTDRMHVR